MNKGRDLKPHIGIFGRRNNGKSSFINTIVGQEVAIVSEQAGTTTDPVKKSIEIFGIGPAIIVDTAGIDDTGTLGQKRIEKTLQVLKTIDCAILIITANTFGDYETELIRHFKSYDIPFCVVHNKSDIEPLKPSTIKKILDLTPTEIIDFSTVNPYNTEKVIEILKKIIPETSFVTPSLLGDIINEKDYIVLVTPIDSEAPEGRMILPQMMAVRDVLDNHCICIVLQETELPHFFNTCNIKPKMVITDSQVFYKVKNLVPDEIMLTSFSIVFSRIKGNFEKYIAGAQKISQLNDGDKILIMESCTHRVSCDDIGRFKIPAWLKDFTGKKLDITVLSGMSQLPDNINDFALVIQCGGCMFTRKQVLNRLKPFIENGIPVTNYGMAIAYMNGIFDRALQPFLQKNAQ